MKWALSSLRLTCSFHTWKRGRYGSPSWSRARTSLFHVCSLQSLGIQLPPKIRQHLTNWTRWNKRKKFEAARIYFFKWHFRSCRRRRCFKAPYYHQTPFHHHDFSVLLSTNVVVPRLAHEGVFLNGSDPEQAQPLDKCSTEVWKSWIIAAVFLLIKKVLKISGPRPNEHDMAWGVTRSVHFKTRLSNFFHVNNTNNNDHHHHRRRYHNINDNDNGNDNNKW